MAVTKSNTLLIVTFGPIVQIAMNCNEITNSVFNEDAICVHVTKDNKTIVGVWNGKTNDGAVKVMNEKGETKKIFRFDRSKNKLFECPRKITSTSNGNVFVLDRRSSNIRGRVVVINQDTEVLNIYRGCSDRSFTPRDIVTTPSDNVIIADRDNHALHILNNI